MKTVIFLKPARDALRKHRNVAQRILDKLAAYAENPLASANQVTELRGSSHKRMRVGNFRVLFEESENEIIVSDLGPRGSICE